MIIKADLKCKQTDFSLPRCAIEKVVKLTPTEYAEFVSNPLGYYDFLREFNAEKHGHQPESIPCLLLIGEGHKDGFIIDTEGYDYARYTAHIPNAEQLAIAFRYPNLENAVIETAFAADRIVREAIDSGNKEYSINTNEERNRFRGAGFSEELLYTALEDRTEIESIDFDGDYMLCTVKDEYVQQSDSRRALMQEEADVMIAKHILWLNDAGGKQADFSNCLVKGLNLAHKNMMNVVMDNARFADTDLQGAELNFSVINDTRFESCNLEDITAEECEFKNTVFSGCRMSGGVYTHSDLSNAVMIECNMEHGSFQNCCTDGTNFCGLDDCTEINMRGCNSDREDWRQDGFDPELTI